MRYSGFTLAELLIALAILGVIATFTIPKVLQSQQLDKRTAIFKEAFGALHDVFHTGRLKGEVDSATDLTVYMQARLNAVKLCPADSLSQGCRTVSSPCNMNHPGMVLHNGAHVNFWSGNQGRTICLDWNGDGEPNTSGQDVLMLYANTGSGIANGVRPGQAGPSSGSPATVTLFEQTFQ